MPYMQKHMESYVPYVFCAVHGIKTCSRGNLTFSLIYGNPSSSCATLQALPDQCPEPGLCSHGSCQEGLSETYHIPQGYPWFGQQQQLQDRGLCPWRGPVLTKPRVARPLTRARAAHFPVLHKCFLEVAGSGKLTPSGHFNHQPWQ